MQSLLFVFLNKHDFLYLCCALPPPTPPPPPVGMLEGRQVLVLSLALTLARLFTTQWSLLRNISKNHSLARKRQLHNYGQTQNILTLVFNATKCSQCQIQCCNDDIQLLYADKTRHEWQLLLLIYLLVQGPSRNWLKQRTH